MRRYRWRSTVIALALVFGVFVVGYGQTRDSSGDDRSSMATERWESTADRGGGKGVWAFTKKPDGTVSVAGEWTYVRSIQCPFSAGSVTISGSSLSFAVMGTATNSSAPPGHQDSPFTLNVKGELRDGKGNGTYTITSSANGWPPGFSGKWTATRAEGKGITE